MIEERSFKLALEANLQQFRAVDAGRKRNQLGQLNRAGAVLSSSLGLEPTLKAILRLALEVTNAEYGIFRLLDESGMELVTAAVEGKNLEEPLIQALPREGRHVTGWVATNRRSLLIGDLREPPWNEYYFPLDRDLEMRSELAVPLLGTGGRLEGVLNLESPHPGAFDDDDQLLLETFAGQAVMAIRQARLLDALQEIAEGVLEMPCGQVLGRLVDLTRHLINATGVELETADRLIRIGNPEGTPAQATLDGSGRLTAYLEEPGEWENKVVACLAHHAVLALKNERRLKQLKNSQQRQALTETFAAVGDLSANLLHQLNNKIGAIPVRVEGILDKAADQVEESPYLAKNLQKIQDSAHSALQTVRQNLSILRPRASGMVNLEQCAQRATKELGLNDLLRYELMEVPPVYGDFRSLTLVFLNLFENAARAMQGKGQILVVGKKTEDAVLVKVADNGPGIPIEVQSSVFELSNDRSRPHNLGFGLWWVRTVMERMDGSIELESDGKTGTVFTLEFPLP